MQDPLFITLAPQLVFLTLCALLSASEASLNASSDSEVNELAERGDARAKRLVRISDDTARFFSAIRYALTLCAYFSGVFAAGGFITRFTSLLTRLGVQLPQRSMYLIGMLAVAMILALVMVIFGEFIPRRAAIKNPLASALALSGFISAVTVVMKPFSFVVRGVSLLVLRLMGMQALPEDEYVTEDEILQLVDIGEESGAIDSDERDMIENIFEFDDSTAGDIMTHRTDLFALCVNASDTELLSVIKDSGKSRFPVYGKDIDDIVGVINARDFLLDRATGLYCPISKLMRKPFFVPEELPADALFRDMKRRKQHIAVVVDDYGGTSGVVTLEDLLEEIVGDIYDEYDHAELADIRQLSENIYMIEGTADLEEVADTLNVELPVEEYDTMSGYIFSLIGSVPEDGTTHNLETPELLIEVPVIDEHRVTRARVTVKQNGTALK